MDGQRRELRSESPPRDTEIGIDLDSDPTVAAFVLNMPAYKMLQMAPIMTPEELDEILGE